MRDFIGEYPPDFKIKRKSVVIIAKKQVAHNIQKDYEMVITWGA